jgi:hypothetical protein
MCNAIPYFSSADADADADADAASAITAPCYRSERCGQQGRRAGFIYESKSAYTKARHSGDIAPAHNSITITLVRVRYQCTAFNVSLNLSNHYHSGEQQLTPALLS